MTSPILTGESIAQAIKQIKPRRIAVAYLGNRWETYIPNLDTLEAIIVSPRLGTNPWAVQALVSALGKNGKSGWDRVFFHDDLHAKLYLGAQAAVVGSANLSGNGLSEVGLVELCLQVKEAGVIEELDDFFSSIQKVAISQYPTAADKKRRLDQLTQDTLKAPFFSKVCRREVAAAFNPDAHGSDFYVAYYVRDWNFSLSEAASPFVSLIHDQMHFLESDNPESGKWVLCWPLTGKQLPDHRTKPSWLLIDEVIPEGVNSDNGYTYTKLAIQRNDYGDPEERLKHAPFSLTKPVIEALRTSLTEPGVAEYLIDQDPSGDAPWSLDKSLPGVPVLIERMRIKLAQAGL